MLDAIAWYGGNSGVDFDLEEGEEIDDWAQKQYPHTKVGTRWVRQRRRNPWGLHDMLGNVEEWCGNELYPYTTDPTVDPEVAMDISEVLSYRVIRGGSWDFDAQDVRAAYHRGYRYDDLGFRLARGRASGGWGPDGPRRTTFVVSSAPFEGGRSPSGAAPERQQARKVAIPGPTTRNPYWQEDQDELGAYADVRVPDTQVGFRMRLIQPGAFWYHENSPERAGTGGEAQTVGYFPRLRLRVRRAYPMTALAETGDAPGDEPRVRT